MPTRIKDLGKALQKEFRKALGKASPKKNQLNIVGEITISLLKKRVKGGQSPIDKGGRFPAYKRARDPLGYPNTVRKRFPTKRRRPVNLTLSGDFLSKLKYRVRDNKTISVGFLDQLSAKKEQGHREGANTQPKRPIIPQRNENFSKSISREIRQQVIKLFKKNLK